MRLKDFRTRVYVRDMIDIYINQNFVDTIDMDVTKYDELGVGIISVNKETGHLEAYLYLTDQSVLDFI